nr:phage major capsid protein [Burkholderia multivorans]
MQAIVADSGVGTVGGINASSWAFWQNIVQSAAAPIQGGGAIAPGVTTIESLMLPLWIKLTRGSDTPDLIVMSDDYFAFYEQSQTSLKRYAPEDNGQGGMVSMKYKTADVFFDSSGGIPAQHAYFLNTDFLEMVVHRDANMDMPEELRSVNQDAVVMPMGNFRHVNVSSGQATNEYASVGQIQNAGFMLLGAGTGTISTSQSITSTGGNITSGSPTLNNQPQVRLQNSNRLMYFFQNTEGTVFGLFDGTSSNIRWQTDPASNFTVTGNITASSDERLKKDWDSLPDDFVERLANVLHGSFTRIDTGARQVGVGARSLRELLPEAVSGDDVLSVAYGNAALVSAIQLAIELLKLRDRVAALEGA